LPKGSVTAGSHTSPSFDCRLYSDPCPVGNGGLGIFRKKGVHITSDVDIVAYAHIFGNVSSGATMLLPTNSWGYSYTTINSYQANQAGSNSYNYFFLNCKRRFNSNKDYGISSCKNKCLLHFSTTIARNFLYC
jgi:hypothetical protein